MLEERLVRVPHGGIDHLGVGLDHLRGDALVDRADQRREVGLEFHRSADPRHQLRLGHRCFSLLFVSTRRMG